MTLVGCVAPATDGINLPPRALVIPDPVPLPDVHAGQDARVVAGEARQTAAENARRLTQAGERYDALRRSYTAH
jgi:hypothetical protein